MPIHKVGYRKWEGKKTSAWGRWWIIGETGIRLALKSSWVKRALFACWMPIILWGTLVFMVETQLNFQQNSEGAVERVVSARDLIREESRKAAVALLEEADLENNSELRIPRTLIRMLNPNLIRFDPEDEDAVPFEIIVTDDGRDRRRVKVDRNKLVSRIEQFVERIEEAEKNLDPRQQMVDDILFFAEERLPVSPRIDILREKLSTGETSAFRHTIWSWLLMTFFRYPQGTLILFLLGYIAPGLISRDLRSRAYLLYFSRPIGRLEYIAGKMSTVICYIVMCSTIPALGLFVFSVMLSPDATAFLNTWDIIFRILAASLVLAIPLSSLVLMFSSLTHESRFATFAWFAVWALGEGAYWIIVSIKANQMAYAAGGEVSPADVMNSDMVNNWSFLSLHTTLGRVQSWVFGFETIDQVWPALLVLVFITVFSLVVLFRRVSAPIRA